MSELTARAKRQLRRRARSTRSALPKEALAARSAQIVERVAASEAFRAARKVALFWPLVERAEVDLRALDAMARAEGKALYYPFLEGGPASLRTGFRLSRDATDLEVREQRFAEPPPDAPEALRGDVDLVVVPALAAAPDGHRLGYGLGFYDATLPDVCPPARSLVVVYDFEVLAEVPSTSHDVACDWVVTDLRTFERKA